jgi:hypothetical protein
MATNDYQMSPESSKISLIGKTYFRNRAVSPKCPNLLCFQADFQCVNFNAIGGKSVIRPSTP